MLRVLTFVILLLQAQLLAAGSETETDTEAYQILALRLQKLDNFSGSFEQRQYDEDGLILQQLSGSFAIETPGKVRWQTLEPMAQLLISDGEQYWLYDPDLEQVTVSQIGGNVQQTPAVLFSGDPQSLRQRYAVEQTDSDRYVLHSRIESEIFHRIDITFEGASVASMVMRDRLGQRTEFVFDDIVTNGIVDPAIFSFVPPDHVDIIYQ